MSKTGGVWIVRSVIVATLFLSVTLLSGCGTIFTLVQDQDIFLAYSGIRCHFEDCDLALVPPWENPDLLYIVVWALPDFVLSLVMDTLALPFTILRELWHPHDPDYKWKGFREGLGFGT